MRSHPHAASLFARLGQQNGATEGGTSVRVISAKLIFVELNGRGKECQGA